jgi:hypothetical protein
LIRRRSLVAAVRGPLAVLCSDQLLAKTSAWCSPTWGGRREMRQGDFGAMKGPPA